MSKNRLLSILVLAVTSFIPPPLMADRVDLERFYFSPEIAYVLPTDGDVDDTFFLGGRVGYNFDENWALELESGWMEMGVDTPFGDNLDIAVVPIMGNVRYNFDRQDWGNGYVFGGVGGSINDLEEDLGTDTEVDDSVAWQVGGGVEAEITDSLDGFLDIRYFWNEPDISESGVIGEQVLPSDANLESVFFTVGIEF